MKMEIIPVGEIGANCILLQAENRDALVIDPGAEPALLLERVRLARLTVKAILLTHGHYDHVGALSGTVGVWQCPVLLHEADHPFYFAQEAMVHSYAGGSLLKEIGTYPADGMLDFGSGLALRVIHTPGHSAGSVCLELLDGSKTLLTGDTIFQGAVGRTDIPGGSPRILSATLRMLVRDFPDHTLIPGHGPATTMEEEIRENFFLSRIRP